MAEALTLDVVTPENILLSQEVYMAVVPGVEGEMGVLVDHAPVISTIRPGVVRVYDQNNKIEKRVLVSGGFVEVTSDRCTILATKAHDFDVVSKEELEDRLATIKKIHEAAEDENEKIAAEKDLDIAQEIVDAFVLECDSFGK